MSAAAQGGRDGRAPAVRVVIISTHYVETYPANFKSVVQRLTGKHSHHIHTHHQLLPPPVPKRRKILSPPPSQVATTTAGITVGSSSNNNMNSWSSSSSSLLPSSSVKLSRGGVSVSDLDGLHTLLSWEEISQLCM